ANSSLVTTDIGVTFFVFLTLSCLWRWAARPRPIVLVASGLALRAAFASKSTAAWILPAVGLLAILRLRAGADLPARPWSSRSAGVPPGAPLRARLVALALAGAIVLLAAFLAVSLACGVTGLPDYVA